MQEVTVKNTKGVERIANEMFNEFKVLEDFSDADVLASFKQKKHTIKEDKESFELIFELFYDRINEFKEQKVFEDEKKKEKAAKELKKKAFT
jgi:hypothetical protein